MFFGTARHLRNDAVRLKPRQVEAQRAAAMPNSSVANLASGLLEWHCCTLMNLTISEARVALERDMFLRLLIRELSGTLQDVVGLHEAAGFVSVVGQRIGSYIDDEYRNALKVERLTREQVTQVLVDLKRRIQGDFYVIEETDEKIVLGNRRCPFEEKVKDRPAMCMMTSNVFGSIAANNLGYAKVELKETIAEGAPGCRVVIYLSPSDEAQQANGREYFDAPDENGA